MSRPEAAAVDQSQPVPPAADRGRREAERALVTAAFRAAAQGRTEAPPPPEPPTVAFTELPAAGPHSPLAREWDVYRREAAKLLADGHEGQFVLIKGDSVVGIWGTAAKAEAAALERYPMQPCLIHEVHRREPLFSLSPRVQQWLG
jgi:hypothetical protein